MSDGQQVEAAADGDWQVQLVRDELVRASGIGEQRSRAQLQEACGIGAGDLEQVLAYLCGHGEATEVAPDEFEAGEPEDERQPVEAVAVSEGPVPGPLPPSPSLLSLAEAERAAGRGAPSTGGVAPAAERRVELPMGVAGALDEAALGKIVKAGIDEARGVGAEFVLVVTP